METKYFSLEVNNGNRITRIFQLIFGILCIAISIGWVIINFSSLATNSTLLITLFFLLGFGYYQINSGLGKGEKFVETGANTIKLKVNSILPAKELKATDIIKTEIFPLSIVFNMKSGKKLKLRFGTTYTEIIDPARKAVADFCTENNLEYEFIQEEL